MEKRELYKKFIKSQLLFMATLNTVSILLIIYLTNKWLQLSNNPNAIDLSIKIYFIPLLVYMLINRINCKKIERKMGENNE